jgi:hypothetical protein
MFHPDPLKIKKTFARLISIPNMEREGYPVPDMTISQRPCTENRV